jgi:hypothetical protein
LVLGCIARVCLHLIVWFPLVNFFLPRGFGVPFLPFWYDIQWWYPEPL